LPDCCSPGPNRDDEPSGCAQQRPGGLDVGAAPFRGTRLEPRGRAICDAHGETPSCNGMDSSSIICSRTVTRGGRCRLLHRFAPAEEISRRRRSCLPAPSRSAEASPGTESARGLGRFAAHRRSADSGRLPLNEGTLRSQHAYEPHDGVNPSPFALKFHPPSENDRLRLARVHETHPDCSVTQSR